MKLVRNPEVRGIAGLVLVILILGGAMAVWSGKLEQWFGITIGSGPRMIDSIVFVSDRSGTSEVYMMNVDGTGQQQLTKGARVLSEPCVAPNGSRALFVGMHKSASQVFSITARGGEAVRITSATGPKQQPSFSPDGKRMSFISSGTVYVTDLSGESLDRALPTPEELQVAMTQRGALPAYLAYAWTPDAKGMAGVTKDMSEDQLLKENDVLVVVPEFRGEVKRIPFSATERAVIKGICWAAEKPVLAMAAAVGKRNVLAVLDLESEEMRPLAMVDDQQFGRPAIAPDASALVCAVKSLNDEIPSGLVRLDLSTGQGELLAEGDFDSPAYSPDGDMLLAAKLDAGRKTRDIVLVDLSSGEMKQLTDDGRSHGAVWSPKSRK